MRILIADVQEGVDRLTRVLCESHSLLIAKTLVDANKLVARWEDVDAIICGIQFDDSRMLELLAAIKSSGSNKHIPFICFRQASTGLSFSSEHATDLAATVLGACAYINASEITEASDAELLNLIETQLELDRPQRELRKQKRIAPAVKGYRILFLDDRADHINALLEAGGLGGHEVRVAHQLSEAHAWLDQRNHVDVIISCTHMGKNNIIEFIEKIKLDAHHSWMQFVLLAAEQKQIADFLQVATEGPSGLGADKYVVMEKFDAMRLLKEIEASLPARPPQKIQDPDGERNARPTSVNSVPLDVTDAQHDKGS